MHDNFSCKVYNYTYSCLSYICICNVITVHELQTIICTIPAAKELNYVPALPAQIEQTIVAKSCMYD